jgi:Concanavalin A-like lectin/glucanases superfamily
VLVPVILALVFAVGHVRADNTASIALNAPSDQCLAASSSPSLFVTGDLTIEAWVKFASFPTSGLVYFVTKDGVDPAHTSYVFYGSGTYLGFLVSGSGGDHVDTTSWTPALNTWYHLAAVYSSTSGNVSFYVDGSYLEVSRPQAAAHTSRMRR